MMPGADRGMGHTMKNIVKIVGVVATLFVLFLVDVMVQDVEAIAGVRRRTARRTAVIVGSSTAAAASASTSATQQQQAATAEQQAATAQQQSATAQQQAAAATAAPAPTAMVASLPAGCVSAGEIFQCGNVYYKPYMSGGQIVYGVVSGP